jgi:predicted phosphoribosyltransferase
MSAQRISGCAVQTLAGRRFPRRWRTLIRMNTYHRFANRAEAAEALALHLQDYRGCRPLVLAIPRGAVPMGKIIAERLQGELDIVLVRKLGAPFDPEYAIGAIDETGWTYLAPLLKRHGENFLFIKQKKAHELEVLRRRRAQYSPHRPAINPQGRVVIIVDDGIATGSTMIAALHATRAKDPVELICAIPVAPPKSIEKIEPMTDRVICLYAPFHFLGVGQFYHEFSPVDDREIVKILAHAGQ